MEGVFIMSNHRGDPRPDWSRYGVSETVQSTKRIPRSVLEDTGRQDELFNSDLESQSQPWWKANFLLTETVQFGTWDGVFTSCMLNIFGIVIFLRTGWMVGVAGLGYAVLIIVLTMLIALIAVLGAIGVCERCQVEAGGVYFLVSHVLGTRVGSSIGFLYCFGQAVASSLYIAGFGESISSLVGYTNPWIAKGIGIGVVVLLLGINLAGIKWVIRLQLVLLLILLISVLDFLVGSFIKQSPVAGVVGYNIATFSKNTAPQFINDHHFFSVFGIFFPTATGVCAGINMSGDLRNPKRSIPIGTLSAIGVSFTLYVCFALVLAGKCSRFSLQTDNMITTKVALLGPLLLFGLYVSSLSSALGGVSTAPKLLQAIAETTKLPGTSILSKSWGRNRVPVVSILCVVSVTLSFVLIGDVNILGPIVTMPFLLTYGTLSYSYFVLAKSFDIRRRRDELFEAISDCKKLNTYKHLSVGRDGPQDETQKLLFDEIASDSSPAEIDRRDLDRLFPERQMAYGSTNAESNQAPMDDKRHFNDIVKQPRSFYARISNRWISLFGTIMFLWLMFAVNWMYALTSIFIWALLYFYIGLISPGLFPGVAEFSLICWLSSVPRSIANYRDHGEARLLMPSQTPVVRTEEAAVTEESKDYISREKYHQSKVIHDDGIMRALAHTDSDE